MDSELDRLAPDTQQLTLTTGFPVEIVRMKTRQFFRMLKILTHGAGPRLIQEGLNFSDDPTVFAGKLAALVAMSIPDAEAETIDFLKSMCQPAGIVGGIGGKQQSQMSKQETENDVALWAEFNNELFNPDILDTYNLVELIVRQESADVQALGKKLMALMDLASRTGQDKPETPEATPEASDLHLPEPSPGPSTSSATSTGGQTKKSSPSRSAASARRPRQPETAGTPSS